MKTLGKVEAKLSRMKEQTAAVRWFYENGNLPESYNRALRLEELSEQAVLLTRVLPAYTGAVGATIQTDAIISDTIPVEASIGCLNTRISIRIYIPDAMLFARMTMYTMCIACLLYTSRCV